MWTAARLVAAAVIASAVLTQGVVVVATAAADGRHVATVTANFFSFFTILSNIGAAGVLAWSGLRRLPRRRRQSTDPPALAVAFLSVTTYLVITGAVYNLLLRAISIGPDTVGWANEVLHVWAPLFLLADLLLGAGHRMLPWRAAVAALAFPAAWIAYTLLRGPLITAPSSGAPYWYPYPFLDPHGPGGWPGVGAYVVGIAVGIIAVAFGAVAVLRLRAAAWGKPTPARQGHPAQPGGESGARAR